MGLIHLEPGQMCQPGSHLSLVRSRLDPEAGAGGVVERDDLAADLGTLRDGSGGPGHVQRMRVGADGVLPVTRLCVETDHAGALSIRGSEGARDEETVVGVVIVHVAENGGHDVVAESWHETTLVDADVGEDGA